MTRWPEHRNPKKEHAAKAPYNFVPLPRQVVTVDPLALPDQDAYDPDRYTGHMQCTLTTASPLYVRAANTSKDFEKAQDSDQAKLPFRERVKNRPDFFHMPEDTQPVIPGSSLRGLLRALVEIAGYGKMQWVADRQLVYRAVGDTTSHGEAYRERLMCYDGESYEDGKRYYQYTPLMRAGYMKQKPNGDWAIQPARQIDGTTFARIADGRIPAELPHLKCRNASTIWVQLGRYEYQKVRGGFIRVKYTRVLHASGSPEPGLVKATLARSGWMPNKRSEAVVYPADETADPIDIDDDLVRAYRTQITDVYGRQALRGQKQESLLGENGVLEDGHPVFYLVDNGQLIFLGHCMMIRLPYRLSPLDFVPEALRRESDTDLAEAIFGYTRREVDSDNDERETPAKMRAYAGRVSVSDGHLCPGQPGDVWLAGPEGIVPRILGGPKPTTFQHYLTQQKPDPIPTGGRFSDGSPRTRLELSDYAVRTPGESVVRGHKGYWHKGPVGRSDIEEPITPPDSDKQHTLFRPVKADVRFEFTLDFQNLSAVELGALLWVLNLAADDRYRLNLGMGKPYGMGAVKIESALYLTERGKRYGHLFDEHGWWDTGPQEAEGIRSAAIAAFEGFVLKGSGEEAHTLAATERISMLLALLSWPGPPADETRYLEIERKDPTAKHGKVNEYKDRPVLPDPTALAGRPVRDTRPPDRPAPALPAGYQRGRVKSFGLGPKQSFGFIVPEEGGGDVFVHQSNLAQGVDTLKEGQMVAYRPVKGPKGMEAHDVLIFE